MKTQHLAPTILSSTLFLSFSAAAQPYAYVANAASLKVSVVNRSTNALAGMIYLPAAATGLDVTPSSAELYAAYGNGVAVVNLSTKAVTATIPLPGVPQNIVVSPNGLSAYVTLPNLDRVGIIDTTTKRLVTTLPAGDRPWMVAFNPVSTRAYVTGMYSGTVTIIDTATKTVVGRFNSGAGACSVIVSLDGTKVYVGNVYAGTITVHSETGTLFRTLAVAKPSSMDLSPTGDRLYVTNTSTGKLSVYSTSTLALIKAIPVGMAPSWVAVASTRAYVANQYGMSMSVSDTVNDVIVSTIYPVGAYPVAVALGK